ncbi:hypothetical protein B0H19DRAFT_1066895 [Mycena capillaripes]|nr:hypothetical protein B0H19DRAFT_1066895 [Mycena capillaripes]
MAAIVPSCPVDDIRFLNRESSYYICPVILLSFIVLSSAHVVRLELQVSQLVAANAKDLAWSFLTPSADADRQAGRFLGSKRPPTGFIRTKQSTAPFLPTCPTTSGMATVRVKVFEWVKPSPGLGCEVEGGKGGWEVLAAERRARTGTTRRESTSNAKWTMRDMARASIDEGLRRHTESGVKAIQ